MEVRVCIPTLNAYKELDECIKSINSSSIKVDEIVILDNGNAYNYTLGYDNVTIYRNPINAGVAGSWNWFIINIPGIKIISNDDIVFTEKAIEIMVNSMEDDFLVFPSCVEGTNSFSCFILPDKIINDVGLFDEWISPKYAYFEDNDYSHRMSLKGYGIKQCEAVVRHGGSSTIKNFDRTSMNAHHEKFRLARSHYVKKWGGEPGSEVYTTPFGNRS